MVSASALLSFQFLSAGRSLELKNIQKFSQPINPALPLYHFPALHFAGGEATSYTFLPRKDDFQPNSPFTCSTPLPNVIKLSEATIPTVVDSLLKRPSTSADSVEESGEKGGAEEKFVEVESDDDNEANFGGLSDAVEMDGLDEDLKEKGVPSVMRCFDRAKIYVKSGDGGNGVVAFRREKFVPYGGPSGGDGGKGGDIYAEVDGSMNSLLPFRSRVHFRAGRGRHGQGKKQSGAKGEDVVVKVPPGTLIRESGKGGVEGELLLELLKPGQRALLVSGGRGGKGNASFKSGARKVPKIAENGEAGIEMWLSLELKLVADVGVVSLDYENTMVVADLPGLLDGAHRGFGLGHEFLRHTERCVVLVHVVDGSSQQPDYEFDAVRLELELFSPGLSKKPYMVVFNKMDLPEAYEKWDSFKNYLQNRGIEPLSISAMYKQGTNDVVFAANALLQKEMAKKAVEEESEHSGTKNIVANAIDKHHHSPMTDFEVFRNRGSNKWHVVGSGIERFVQMTNWRYTESLRRFQHALEACGVNKALQKDGIREGDTVIVGEMEMIWNNEKEQPATAKRVSGSVRWPHFG